MQEVFERDDNISRDAFCSHVRAAPPECVIIRSRCLGYDFLVNRDAMSLDRNVGMLVELPYDDRVQSCYRVEVMT